MAFTEPYKGKCFEPYFHVYLALSEYEFSKRAVTVERLTRPQYSPKEIEQALEEHKQKGHLTETPEGYIPSPTFQQKEEAGKRHVEWCFEQDRKRYPNG